MNKSLKLSLVGFTLFLSTALWLSTVVGCEEAIITPEEETVDPYAVAVEITPGDLTIISGESFLFEAIIINSDSSYDTGLSILWQAEDSSILSIDDKGSVLGLQDGKTKITASYEDLSGEVHVNVIDKRRAWGEARLENQTDQIAIMISWLPLGQEQKVGRARERYVITDSLGAFSYPLLADGEWVFTAEYPYYTFVRDTITFIDGQVKDGTYKPFYLNQELAFEVVLEKTVFTLTDSIWVTFKATNLTNDTIQLVTWSGPIYWRGFAITNNAKPLWYFNLNRSYSSFFGGETILPGETLLVDSYDDGYPGYNMVIDLNLLNKYNYIKAGETYEIYAGYVTNVNYPIQYFERDTYENRVLNNSLYKKLTPQIIRIE